MAMAEGEGCVELKFRIYDGMDICHGTYASSTTIATLKQRLVSEWPQGCGFFESSGFIHVFILLLH